MHTASSLAAHSYRVNVIIQRYSAYRRSTPVTVYTRCLLLNYSTVLLRAQTKHCNFAALTTAVFLRYIRTVVSSFRFIFYGSSLKPGPARPGPAH